LHGKSTKDSSPKAGSDKTALVGEAPDLCTPWEKEEV